VDQMDKVQCIIFYDWIGFSVFLVLFSAMVTEKFSLSS